MNKGGCNYGKCDTLEEDQDSRSIALSTSSHKSAPSSLRFQIINQDGQPQSPFQGREELKTVSTFSSSKISNLPAPTFNTTLPSIPQFNESEHSSPAQIAILSDIYQLLAELSSFSRRSEASDLISMKLSQLLIDYQQITKTRTQSFLSVTEQIPEQFEGQKLVSPSSKSNPLYIGGKLRRSQLLEQEKFQHLSDSMITDPLKRREQTLSHYDRRISIQSQNTSRGSRLGSIAFAMPNTSIPTTQESLRSLIIGIDKILQKEQLKFYLQKCIVQEDEIRFTFQHFRRLYWLLQNDGRSHLNEELHGGCYLTKHIVRQWLYDLYMDDDVVVNKMMRAANEERIYFRHMLNLLIKMHTLSFEKYDFMKFKAFAALQDTQRSGVLCKKQVDRAFYLAAKKYTYQTTVLFFIKMPKIKGFSTDKNSFYMRHGLFQKCEEFVLLKDLARLSEKKKMTPKELILF